jgi:hypothetical protein
MRAIAASGPRADPLDAAATDLAVNVLVHRPFGLTLAEIGALGVRRVSLGGAVARAVEELKEGRFEVPGTRIAGRALNGIFAAQRACRRATPASPRRAA